ncbi:hypothetical protein AWW66_10260 [Micromonospora rosaria]|uniref:Uncharacterized protein n=1 Tax=Micromonospora rosaria TaxID=47874 RepID=A0A136PUU1_9ACTN|nr:hypothetical protein [Micromonospora rosaria]KXK62117.1 hypothetical protein AWW66_10260 [Micromonospora rosaria]
MLRRFALFLAVAAGLVAVAPCLVFFVPHGWQILAGLVLATALAGYCWFLWAEDSPRRGPADPGPPPDRHRYPPHLP